MSPWESGQGPSSRVTSREKPSLESLPSEILKTILSYAGLGELAILAAVSQSFHELAAAELYRNVHQCFPDRDRDQSQLSVDSLAAVLETLTTGEHDYARFVKSLSIDAESDGCADQTARDFKYENSAGKFLNTLVLAALKKIPALETFRWNIRVEIGHSTFLVLSKLPSLKDLHVRLQPGPSLHSSSIADSPPPPVPQPVQFAPPHALPVPSHLMHQHHGGSMVFVPSANPPAFPYPQPPKLGAMKYLRTTPRLLLSRLMARPDSFSCLSELRSLSVLDIDSYGYISEISACVSSSSATLKSLKLSISESVATKARRRAHVAEADTAVEDVDSDEFFNGINIPPPPPLPIPATGNSPNTATTPSNTQAEIRKERTAQEEALAQILGVADKEDPGDTLLERLLERSIAVAYRELQLATQSSFVKGHDQRFMAKVNEIAEKLIANQNDASYQSGKAIGALEMIGKAAATYLEDQKLAEDLRNHTKLQILGSDINKNQVYNGESSLAAVTASSLNVPEKAKHRSDSRYYEYLVKLCEDVSHPPTFPFDWDDDDSKIQFQNTNTSSSDKLAEQTVESPFEPSGGESGNSGGIFDGEKNHHGETMSDIVDMEHPDDDEESGDDQQSADERDEWDTRNKVPAIGGDIISNKGKQPIRNNPSSTRGAADSIQEALLSGNDPVQQYLKSSHGLCLDSLSIYLMPVKAGVLANGVDISNLKHLSLLNVGSQGRFWSMLSKFYLPLKLTSIHTDNVTHEFLHVLDDLKGLTELFLFERSRKSKVPSLAPRTTVDIEHLRTHVLKRHLQSLRRLVIRNEDDSAWVFNTRSVLALGRHGGQLTELTIGLDSESLHLFVQHLTRFRSLYALQILFYNHENCFSVAQELRYSIADTVVHCPVLSVRYVSVFPSPMTMNRGVAPHLVTEFKKTRPSHSPGVSSYVRGYTNNKGFVEQERPSSGLGVLPNKKTPGNAQEAYSVQDESSDDEPDLPPTQTCIAGHDVRLCDVIGVKMWERESWAMKL